jgi:SAM-dependent methyltransferase
MDLTRFADEYWAAKDDAVDQERLGVLCGLVPAGARVLVVDAGPGMLPARLREAGHEVVMTDLSEHACERARAKGLEVHRVDTDDERLPFADGAFDCVVSDSAIEHRYYPRRALEEAARVLRPGGRLVLLVPNIAHWRYRLWLLCGRLPEVEGGPSDWCHLRFFGAVEARRMLRELGLTVGRTRGFPSLWVKGLYPKVFRAPGVKQLYGVLTRLRPTLFGRDVILVGRKD